jgi:hypothetical protein
MWPQADAMRLGGWWRQRRFWSGNGRADWKVASRFVNLGILSLLGSYRSGAYVGNPD